MASDPPNADSDTTPFNDRIVNHYYGTTKPRVAETRTQLRKDMLGKYIRVSYDDFMQEFLPALPEEKPPNFGGLFADMQPKKRKMIERELNHQFVRQ